MSQSNTQQRIGFRKRFLAYLIDFTTIVVGGCLIFGLAGWVLGSGAFLRPQQDPTGMLGIVGFLGISIGILLGPAIFGMAWLVWEGVSGISFGKWLLGIRIRREDGGEANKIRLFMRAVLKHTSYLYIFFFTPILIPGKIFVGVLFVVVFLIPWLVLLGALLVFTESKQALHDKVGASAVYPTSKEELPSFPKTFVVPAISVPAITLLVVALMYISNLWLEHKKHNAQEWAQQAEIPQLIQTIKNEDSIYPFKKEYAIQALGEKGTKAKPAIGVLIEVLKENDWGTSSKAAQALAQIGPSSVKPLIQIVDHPSPAVRAFVIQTLGNIGPAAQQATPHLLPYAQAPELSVRMVVLEALPKIKAKEQVALPVLIEGLQDQHELVRATAAESLGKMGAKAKPALTDLKKALKDEDWMVRDSASEAIERIEGTND